MLKSLLVELRKTYRFFHNDFMLMHNYFDTLWDENIKYTRSKETILDEYLNNSK